MKKTLGVLIVVLGLFALCNAGWAANPAAAPATPAVASSQPGCQPAVLDLGKTSQTKGGTCSAAAALKTQVPQPEFMIGTKTCRCSCGYPCKTDADCGGALGSCRAGISCC